MIRSPVESSPTLEIRMRSVLVIASLLTLSLMFAKVAAAAEYAFTESYSCVETAGTFTDTLQLTAPGFTLNGSASGTSIVNPDGSGTSNGTSSTVFTGSNAIGDQPVNFHQFNCNFQIFPNPDGSFIENVACSETNLGGAGFGTPFGTFTFVGTLTGQTDPTGRVTVYGVATPQVATLTFSDGTVHKTLCSRNGVSLLK
jgi:hypothetical protein